MRAFLVKFNLSRNEQIIFLIALLIALAAKGAALFPFSYGVDDYHGMLIPSSHSNEFRVYLSQGRFGLALISKFVYFLGAGAPQSNTFYVLLYMISLAWAGIIVCRMWKADDDIVLSTIIVLMISIHPYQAELFTFKISPLYVAVAYGFAFSAFYVVEFKWTRYVLANILLVFALSIYQITLNLLFITLCMALLLVISRQIRNLEDIDWRAIFIDSKLVVRSILLCSGVIFYLGINKFVQLSFHILPSERSLLIKPGEVLVRLSEISRTLHRMYFDAEPILPASVKMILMVLLILAFVLVGKQIIRNCKINRIAAAFGLSTLLLFAGLGIIGIIIPMQCWYPVPRVLSGASFFWAGIVAFTYLNAVSAEAKFIVISMCCVVIFSFIGINNHIFTDQLRVNMRDMQKANRIIYRMESNPSFPSVRKVVIVGDFFAYQSPIYTSQGDMNMSAFGPDWAKVNVLKEVSGYDFAKATEGDQKIAVSFCEQAPKWPSENSLVVLGDLCIVCQ